ncbi:MAG: sugar transferase [Candidatus Sulfotelmatobacter sp.]
MKTLYGRAGKRIFDIAVSSVALVMLTPLFGILAVLVKITSRGPIFYRQARVGRDGRTFQLVKFRSMFVNSDRNGLLITSAGDRRITPFGRILRSSKMDELPQLWNVVWGEMSLVGPRPEVALYVDSYSAQQRDVLTIRPGITDWASIAYREEEKVLASRTDPDLYYREVILPDKIELNRKYLNQMSFSHDLRLLFHTIAIVLFPRSVVRRLMGDASEAPGRASETLFLNR